jgi:hypothetical protein
VLIVIQAIEAAVGAVGHVEVGPAVAIEVGDGDGRATDATCGMMWSSWDRTPEPAHEVSRRGCARTRRARSRSGCWSLSCRLRALFKRTIRGQRDEKNDEPDHLYSARPRRSRSSQPAQEPVRRDEAGGIAPIGRARDTRDHPRCSSRRRRLVIRVPVAGSGSTVFENVVL